MCVLHIVYVFITVFIILISKSFLDTNLKYKYVSWKYVAIKKMDSMAHKLNNMIKLIYEVAANIRVRGAGVEWRSGI